MKTALIFGITGQDGSFMCDLLLEKGYSVHGVIRRSSNFNTQRLDHVFNKNPNLYLHYGDITDTMNTFNIIEKTNPDEIYNFSAQSHVKVGSDLENYTFQTNTLGVLNILQAVLKVNKNCKVYQAGTSEQYGNVSNSYLDETSEMKPVSIYGISKLAARNICEMYKNTHNMYIVSSILFNHESERRGDTFVTKKITNYVGKGDYSKPLQLGNLDSKRDWGYAKDYVEAIFLMMHNTVPTDYVIATGNAYSVREFAREAFRQKGITLSFKNHGKSEVALDEFGKVLVQVNEKYYRDIEIDCLLGNASKAKKELGWSSSTDLVSLVRTMLNA